MAEKSIRIIEQAIPHKISRVNVAAYARVSNGKDMMLHSLSAQVSYYNSLIQRNPDWNFVGVYSDEAVTGTKEDRDGFKRLIEDCRQGKIDLVLTKSVTRFARNTVTLLQTIREFKSLGIDVYFEEQNIHTISSEGELMLTILASYAQDESRSASENQKWRIRKNFEQGIPWHNRSFGYRLVDGTFQVIPEEAEVVQFIYDEYLSGKGYSMITAELNESLAFSQFKPEWKEKAVSTILSNYIYTGNLLLQKTYISDHLTKKFRVNKGELPQYHVEDAHEAIIPMEIWNAVQAEKARRAEHFGQGDGRPIPRYPFSGQITCALCGSRFRRKITVGKVKWICHTFNSKGKDACPNSRAIPEETLYDLMKDLLGCREFNEAMYKHMVEGITAFKDGKLEVMMKDGTLKELLWEFRSRRESWTDEMKEAARQKTLERRNKNAAKSNDDSGDQGKVYIESHIQG